MPIASPWNSIRFKMSILSTAVLGVILTLYSLYLFLQLQDVLYRNLEAELKIKAHELAKVVKAFQDTKSPAGDIRYAAIKVLSFDIHLKGGEPLTLTDRQWFRLIDRYDLEKDHVAILSLEGQVLASTGSMPAELQNRLLELFEKHRQIRATWDTVSVEEKDFRVLQMMVFARDTPHYLIQIATPLKTVNQLLQDRLWGIVASIPVVLALTGLSGLLFADRILKPVRKITEAAERLTHQDLSRRVEVARIDTEMLFLVNAFNHMLERLEASFKHVADMTTHIAHELKTPLAIIRGEGQMALRRDYPVEKYREVVKSSIDEASKILHVIDDLLISTKIAYDKEVFNFKLINLRDLLRDILKKSLILAEPKNIRIDLREFDGPYKVYADQIHLRRLFFNLIDNAIKYSPAGSRIQIFTELEDGLVGVSIKDEGEGISQKDLPYIFERTFQTSPSRPLPAEESRVGAGLGLHLCQAIAKAHHGQLKAESQVGKGSTFTLFLPLAKAH